MALVQRRGTDAARLLLSTARRIDALNTVLARETHLEAFEAARAAPPGPDPPRVVDVLLDPFAIQGHS